jgi:ribosome-binding protein aMBF1 (putative translation factor)
MICVVSQFIYFDQQIILEMNRIKESLDNKGIKQTCLAVLLGKNYNMVNGYFQNLQQLRLEVMHNIAKILDVDVIELIVSCKNQTNDKF